MPVTERLGSNARPLVVQRPHSSAGERTDDPHESLRVLLLTRYSRRGPSSRIRCYQYLPYLQAHGLSVEVAPLFEDGYLSDLVRGTRSVRHLAHGYLKRIGWLQQARRFDLVWMQYESLPWLPGWLERGLWPSNVPYLVDYDDAQFHRYDRHSSPLIRWAFGTKVDDVMRRAAVVVAGNRYLAERASRAGARDVRVVPSAVELARYTVRPRSSSSDLTIGWIGSTTTAPYLNPLAAALQKVSCQRRVRVVIVGAESIDIPGVRIETRPWSEDAEPDDVSGFDVGIMPLADGAWERGKCGYKLLQYMAAARPVVASPVGVNREIVRHGETGLLARTTDDWVKALIRLADSPELRRSMGLAGRRRVESAYSTDVTAPEVLKALCQAAGRPVSRSGGRSRSREGRDID